MAVKNDSHLAILEAKIFLQILADEENSLKMKDIKQMAKDLSKRFPSSLDIDRLYADTNTIGGLGGK